MPPDHQPNARSAASAPSVAARALSVCVRGYQLAVSPTLHALAGPGCGCRFTPTCSHYAIEALATHGALRGSALAARRLLRCHPWGGHGADPVPTRASSTSTTAPRPSRPLSA